MQEAKKKLGVQYDPLPWSDFYDSQEIINGHIPVYYAGDEGHMIVCLHGAGHSAMSFAAFAKQVKLQGSRVVAFDWRGHGQHTCENEKDMSE